MSSSDSHRERALDHLDAALASRDTLSDLYARGSEVPRHYIAELHDQVRTGVKVAQVQALLAIEARLADLAPGTDVLADVHLERVVGGAS